MGKKTSKLRENAERLMWIPKKFTWVDKWYLYPVKIEKMLCHASCISKMIFMQTKNWYFGRKITCKKGVLWKRKNYRE